MTKQSNFPIAIKVIINMADSFDQRHKPKLATKLTTIARNLVNIKTAQFVGGQGYWIRNTRCWNNCYRQKRATNKDKTAQEVWAECHSEYMASINDSESGWEKYAEEIGMFKFAGKNMKNTIKTAAQTFHKEMTEKIDAGVEVGVAVHATIQDNLEKYNNSLLDELQELTKVATFLKDKKQIKEATILTSIVNELIKESQMWDWLKKKVNVPGWFGGWGKENIDKLKDCISGDGGLDNLYYKAILSLQRGTPTSQEVFDWLYNKSTTKLNEMQNTIQGMKLKKEDALKIFQQIKNIIAATSHNPSMTTLQTARRNLSSVALGLSQMESMQQMQMPGSPSPTASPPQTPSVATSAPAPTRPSAPVPPAGAGSTATAPTGTAQQTYSIDQIGHSLNSVFTKDLDKKSSAELNSKEQSLQKLMSILAKAQQAINTAKRQQQTQPTTLLQPVGPYGGAPNPGTIQSRPTI